MSMCECKEDTDFILQEVILAKEVDLLEAKEEHKDLDNRSWLLGMRDCTQHFLNKAREFGYLLGGDEEESVSCPCCEPQETK